MITTGINASNINANISMLNGAQLKPISAGGTRPGGAQALNGGAPAARSFGEVFSEALMRDSQLSFSAHAQKRMASRGIKLNASDYSRLESAHSKLAQKGSKEALVMLDDKAFLVSVKNKTVITALDKSEVKQNVFTNIDGAVIA